MKLYMTVFLSVLTGCTSLATPKLSDKCAAVNAAEAFVRSGPDQWGQSAMPGATGISTAFFANEPLYYVHFRARGGDGYYVAIQHGEPTPLYIHDAFQIAKMKIEPVSCD